MCGCGREAMREANCRFVAASQRRHIQIELIKYIGKESNSLEDVESGLVHAEESVYTEYPDPLRDEWQTKIVSALQKFRGTKTRISLLEKLTGLSHRTLIDARTGRRRPHPRNQELIVLALRKLGFI
jgi:hypothetical protein